jgi:hypothetical protein
MGRIRIEYCESLSGTTNPSASTQKLDCYITEQVESPPYTTARLNLPEPFTGGHTYQIQYARRLTFTTASELTTTLRIPAIPSDNVTLDALISEVGAGSITFTLDIGDDGSWDWQTTQPITGPVTPSSPDLAADFNQYWADQGSPPAGVLDVPVRVYLSAAGQVLLTNLYAPSAPPDVTLAAADISFSNPAPDEGDHVTVQAVVSNPEVFTATSIIAAFFAGDPEADGVYLGADFLPAIPPNSMAIGTLGWDTTGFGGNVDLYVILDPTDRVAETNEDNNKAFKPIHVRNYDVFLPVIFKHH